MADVTVNDETPEEVDAVVAATPESLTDVDDTSDQDEPIATEAAQPVAMKAMSYNEIVDAVRDKLWELFDRINSGLPSDEWKWPGRIMVYSEYAVTKLNHQYYRLSYSFDDDNEVVLQPITEWEPVEMEWVVKSYVEDTVVINGSAVKALDDNGRIGGYLVTFTDPDHPDLVGDFFTKKTNFGPHRQTVVFYHHGLDDTLGLKSLGGDISKTATIGQDNVGVWIETQLDLRDAYESAIYGMVQKSQMNWSSGTAQHLMSRTSVKNTKGAVVHHIDNWLLGIDASITPTPAAGPDNCRVVPLKSLPLPQKSIKLLALESSAEPTEDSMKPEDLVKLVKSAVEEAIAPVRETANANAEALKSAPAVNALPAASDDDADDKSGVKSQMAEMVYVTKFGEPDLAVKQIMVEFIGHDYAQQIYDQTVLFAKYLRHGDRGLDANESRLLMKQFFAPSDIKSMYVNGLTMSQIKDMQLSAQGRLGGYALPPMVQEEIVSRLPGMTVVRNNGARVVNLIGSTSVDITVQTGGDAQYTGNMRGRWGGEKAKALPSNITLGQVSVRADAYTFYVPVSRSMLMSSNAVELITNSIIETQAQDEDAAFLTGDGTGGKPLGIIPGGAVKDSLFITKVTSATAGTNTVASDKLLELGDALDDQYENGAVYVMKKSTWTALSKLREGTDGAYLFRPRGGFSEGRTRELLGSPFYRTGAMPAIANGAAPIVFGNMRGYTIVQEPGLSVERMQDSGTGLGEVQFHVYRLLGGRVERNWEFAALETTNA